MELIDTTPEVSWEATLVSTVLKPWSNSNNVESPPAIGSPQVTTEPFDLRAANAPAFENTAVTLEVRLPPTRDVELPPRPGFPQVTSEPFDFRAAKANLVEEIETTPEVRLPPTAPEVLPPDKASPHVTTEPFDFSAAKAWELE